MHIYSIKLKFLKKYIIMKNIENKSVKHNKYIHYP